MLKKTHISQCNDSYVLAEDIINNYGAFIICKGTRINEYILEKLAEQGIEYIAVCKDKGMVDTISYRHFENKYEHIIGDMRCMMLDIAKGKRIDYERFNKVVNAVVSENEMPDHVIKCLGKIKDLDDYTYYHTVNVAFYAMLIGGWLNLARSDIKIIVEAALLHDIGKTRIPEKLLNKKEKLSTGEFDEIKRHAIYGYEIVKDDPLIIDEVKDVILMHHEREDGSGYPHKHNGEELSIYTKIVAIADVYEAMTSNRPYKRAKTPFDAFEEFFIHCRGALNVQIVNTLINNLSRYYIGSKVMLNNGQAASIAYIPPQCMWNPIVVAGTRIIDLSKEKDICIACMFC